MTIRGHHPVRQRLGAVAALGLIAWVAHVAHAGATSDPPQGVPAASRNVTVVGVDYAFHVPAILAPGLTAFSFENRGTVRHEMNLVRLKPGVTVDSLLHVDSGAVNRATRRALLDLKTGGVLVAEPGERVLDRLLVDLTPGRVYLLVCNFQNGPDQPRHSALGMLTTFRVK